MDVCLRQKPRESPIAENAHIAQDQEEYQKRYDGMVAKYDAAKTKFDETIAAISAKEPRTQGSLPSSRLCANFFIFLSRNEKDYGRM